MPATGTANRSNSSVSVAHHLGHSIWSLLRPGRNRGSRAQCCRGDLCGDCLFIECGRGRPHDEAIPRLAGSLCGTDPRVKRAWLLDSIQMAPLRRPRSHPSAHERKLARQAGRPNASSSLAAHSNRLLRLSILGVHGHDCGDNRSSCARPRHPHTCRAAARCRRSRPVILRVIEAKTTSSRRNSWEQGFEFRHARNCVHATAD